MLFRFLLPGLYILLVIALFLGHAQGAGHGQSLELINYVVLPAAYVSDFLLSFFPIGNIVVDLGSAILAGLIQYALLGYILDKVVARYRKRHSPR